MIMKKVHLIISSILALGTFTSCEDFLSKEPLDKHNNDTYWQTETSLRTYAQDFYSNFFLGYSQNYTTFGGFFSGDNFTDDFLSLTGGELYFPTSSITDINASTGAWSDNYDAVYKANVMIEKIPSMPIAEDTKKHWMGIARFFRGMAYSNMIKIYGGVPYIDHVLYPEDEAELYKDRDSYLFVAQKVHDDFQFALDNVRIDDTKLQVNRYVVGAYMSRELLYHATWLKYHGTQIGAGSEKVDEQEVKNLLQGSIKAAKLIIDSNQFRIGNTYNALFSSDELYKNPEIIWHREYTEGVACNALMSYNAGENQTQGGVTQNAIECYLCSDGLPIGQSPLYQGKDDPSVRFSLKNRDPRLYQTIADTLRITSVMGVTYTAGTSPTGYATKKFLNDEWFAAGSEYCKNIQSPADAPCFRYAEVLLNFVEARYEISTMGGEAFSQNDLDLSINQLRSRQLVKWGETQSHDMPKVTLSGSNLSVKGVVINDPVRDHDVAPILWEIRRERRMELMMEGRRGEDLRRWAKYEYLNSADKQGHPDKTFLGAYLRVSDYPGMKVTNEKGERVLILFDPKNPNDKNANQGYINYLRNTNARKFTKGDLNSERYYLRAIPITQIDGYKDKGYKLTQNPGW